ncbi:MAG: glycosyltransferase [Anaerolineae bacterium]|nr:glycosyltransferase [Anaerolineae bacterium]
MNILLISRCPPYPLHLGDRLIVYHLARQLARRGHILDLIAFSDRFEDITDRVHYADLFRSITIIADPPRTAFDYAVRLLVPGARFPHRADQAWSPAMWDAIRQHLDASTYDLAHLFGGIQVYEYARAVEPLPAIITPYESYSLYLRRMVENTPSPRLTFGQLTPLPHQWGEGLIPPSPRLPNATAGCARRGRGMRGNLERLKSRLQLRVARSFESWMFAPYRRVIVVSDRDRDELLALNPALPVEVIPNGVDLDYFQPTGAPREPHTLLFTGNYEYAPNVDAALRLARDIFPRVQAHIPDAKLWIVGSAPPPELTALASEAITVTGHVPDMRTYLETAVVFVCPLRLGAGIKNKVLEALALGCPVVATPLSADGIAVRDGHDILLAESDDQFAAAVVRLFGDAPLRGQLAANGGALIESRYSWAQVAERYEAIYGEIAR